MIFLGFTIIRQEDLDKEREISCDYRNQCNQAKDAIEALNKMNAQQATIIRGLKNKVDEDKLLGLIKVDIGDPTPTDTEARKEYVGTVAAFHKNILEQKCLQMISVFHKLLEEETNDTKTDSILKIGVYVCREWMKWGEGAISEAVGYQTEDK